MSTPKRTACAVIGALLAGLLLVALPVAPAHAAMTASQSAKGDKAKTAKKVILESKPKASSKNVARLAKGVKTTATGKESKGWIQVTAKVKGKKKTGWVRGSALTDVWDSSGKVTVSGDPMVGATLTAAATFAEAGQRVRFSYQWLRNGKPMDDETWETYLLTTADEGTQISVKVTARASGLPTKSVVSARTAAVVPPAPPVESDIDNTSRASVSKAFEQWRDRAQYFLETDRTPVLGANLGNCTTGQLSDTQRTYATSLLNFYREFAGVPKVAYDTALETGTMNAAVLNSVNDQFSHYFNEDTHPKCWSQLSGNTTHNVLMSYGSGLAWGIPGWIHDNYNVQDNVGHRVNLLGSRLQRVAFGLTAGGGIESGYSASAKGAAAVAWTWPPAGWFPASELTTRWSVSDEILPTSKRENLNKDNGDPFDDLVVVSKRTGLAVTVTGNGKTMTPEVGSAWGDWFRMPTGLTPGDYHVTLTGTYTATTQKPDGTVVGSEQVTRTYTYTVRVY